METLFQIQLASRYHPQTHLSGRRLHRVVVEDDVLQLPELPVGCRDLCDLITGEVQSDERQVGQLCEDRREERHTKPKPLDTKSHHTT